MKKQYHKPLVSFESFGLSTSIAQTCAVQMITLTEYDKCGSYGTHSTPAGGCVFYDEGGYVIFASGDCVDRPVDNELGNLCYHVNADNQKVFIS